MADTPLAARGPSRLAEATRGPPRDGVARARVSNWEQSGARLQSGSGAHSAARDRPGEVVAGFLAALAIFAGSLAVVYKPVRIAPVALVVALIAAGIGGRHQRLAALATAVVTVGWVAGMIVCVITERPLF
jgi:hypothetical protein